MTSLEGARGLVRAGLRRASAWAEAEGMPGTRAEGQLLRPLVALAGCEGAVPPARFWDAVLAVQLAHEASLLHDDIIDGAELRRGDPTLVAERGVGVALAAGDHLLTAAYRAAARTRSIGFVERFARAVERTVAGEVAQGRAAGEVLGAERYESIVLGKSGELFGAALSAAATLEGAPEAADRFELGRRIGLLYQRVDDLLDYCPAAGTGKSPLADYRQARWTWVLEHARLDFGLPAEQALAVLRTGSPSPLQRALNQLEEEAAAVLGEVRALSGGGMLAPLVVEWLEAARRAVQADCPGGAGELRAVAGRRLPLPGAEERFMALHSRSFRFASLFFAAEDRARTARVYAWCRFTDDLADRPEAGTDPGPLLDDWLQLSRRAWEGRGSGIPLLDLTMGEAAQAGVPFDLAEELVEGMRMDLRCERYSTAAALRRYTYRVASVVGVWMARSWGVSDPWALERAERLGHAMQLTNILRDVGEDLTAGRLYLPAELMARHGVDEASLTVMARGAPISEGYRELIEELMAAAELDYRAGLEGVVALPPRVARVVRVAAHVYRGIHDEIRLAGHDNLRRRAATGLGRKLMLAGRALWATPPAPAPGGALVQAQR